MMRPETHHPSKNLRKRLNGVKTGHKPMKIKEINRSNVKSYQTGNRAPQSRHLHGRPGVGTALLGAACVAGMFVVLWALYSVG
jgi:hypothetical protein